MTTYFVSSVIGRDNNAGTSATSPLATLQAAADLTKPGDTVLVMNGTYTNGGDVLTISTSGTAGAPITFEAAPGATPIIDSSGDWQGIEINASYITINGFTVVGNAAGITLSDALANSSPGNPYYDGNGIGVALNDQTANFHNIIIENNTIYNEPGAGIGVIGADYVQVLNNNVHDNAHYSAYGASGISIAASVNYDSAPGPHIIVEGNTSVNNAELVPEYRANAITDGEGIILDSNQGYTGGFLVQNNTTHGNSGPGIEAFHSDNAVITGNTTTGDLTNPDLLFQGEIFNNQSNNITVTNNITTSAPPPPPPGQLVVNGGFETRDFAGWTLGGNSGTGSFGPQVYITTNAQSGQYAASLGSTGSDGILSQDVQTTAGQHYTLDFWLANMTGVPNDFTVKWNGQSLLALTNAPVQGYTEYKFDVVGTAGTSQLEFDERQDPSSWSLDSISVTPVGSQPPVAGSVLINDVTISEGNSGTQVATFTVTRSGGTAAFAVNFATSDGTATVADNDYVAASGTLQFGANENTKTISVTINGDTKVEANETFNVLLSNATNGATISDNQGVGTITNDDSAATPPPVAGSVLINDVTISEGNSGTQVATFTVTRSGGTAAFAVNFATSDGTATVADNDYVAASGTLQFGANENTKTISVTINGDTKVEANETFNILLSNATNGATISDNQGVGTITNDDSAATPPPTTNLVANGGFETNSFNGWTLSGNVGSTVWGPQAFITRSAQSGQFAAGLGSMGTDGTLSQNIQTTAGQSYTVQFWLANASAGPDDFTAKWNGQTLVALTNAAAQGYTEYTYNVVGTAGASNLEFDFRQDPSSWSLDNISVTATATGSGPPPPPPPPPGSNLVVNGGFETNSFTGWTLSGNVGSTVWGPQAFITSNAQSGQYAAGLGSMGTDGTLSQNIQTTAGQSYTVQFWLANASGGPDDFTAKWNGQTLVALKNAAAQGYTEYTYNVVGTAGTSNLEFDFRQDPSQWNLDNISVTAVGSQTNVQPSGITASNGQTGAPVTNALAQSNPAPSQNDSVGTMATLLSQYMATSNGSGASISTPPVVAQSSPPPVTLVNPFHA